MSDLAILLTMLVVILCFALQLVTYKYLKANSDKRIFMNLVGWDSDHKRNLQNAINEAQRQIPYVAAPELMGHKVVMWEDTVREILENAFRFDKYVTEKENEAAK